MIDPSLALISSDQLRRELERRERETYTLPEPALSPDFAKVTVKVLEILQQADKEFRFLTKDEYQQIACTAVRAVYPGIHRWDPHHVKKQADVPR